MNKEELLQYLKQKIGNPNIKFPERIDFLESNNIIAVTMHDGTIKNMQEDSAAFEGWALCVKAAMDKDKEQYGVVLDWETATPNNPHYQRFLYRVNKFNELFGGNDGWFNVKNIQRLEESRIKFNMNKQYAINLPAPREWVNESKNSEENYLEIEIVRRQDELDDLKRICPGQIKRQLPVGIFEGGVSKKNAVFPRGKSAIDLWGISGDDFYVLELKAKGNCKVGVLSELFFYVMVLREEQIAKFYRDSDEGKLIRGTKQIKAFIVAPELHPLITPQAFCLLNRALNNKNIEFGYVRIDYSKLSFKFNREI